MASRKTYVPASFVGKGETQVDELCPKCWKPALRRYVLYEMSMDGVTCLGERVACRDCNTWHGPLEEYKYDAA